MLIAVFGDISTADAASKAKELFQNLPKSSAPLSLPAGPDNQFVSEADEHVRIESPDGVGIMAWPTVSLTNEEEYAAILVLQSILGGHGTPGGRLFHSLREEGLVYRLQVGQRTGPAPGYLRPRKGRGDFPADRRRDRPDQGGRSGGRRARARESGTHRIEAARAGTPRQSGAQRIAGRTLRTRV